MKQYIVCIRDAHIRLIGPFENADAMRQYAANNNPTDDPRWQSVMLNSTHFRPEGPYISGIDGTEAYRVGLYYPEDGPMPA